MAAACGLSASESAGLIQSAMIIAGIGTLIQLFPVWKIGSGLPIVMGISFTFVSVMCYIGPTYGYNAVVGAVLVGGIIEGVLGLIVAICMHMVDLSAISGTSVIALPKLLPAKPEFNVNAIVSVTLIFLVSATETIGDTSALAVSGLGRDVTMKMSCDKTTAGRFLYVTYV